MRGGCDVGFVVAMPMECDRVRVAWVRLACPRGVRGSFPSAVV